MACWRETALLTAYLFAKFVRQAKGTELNE
ncbi:hypothetical protein X739_04275 [Mesorhizobium sp. LNHC220B00]|nr:hypothetical protein X739_04275 [Mesorhizobium sp. LNHC220B00]